MALKIVNTHKNTYKHNSLWQALLDNIGLMKELSLANWIKMGVFTA